MLIEMIVHNRIKKLKTVSQDKVETLLKSSYRFGFESLTPNVKHDISWRTVREM